MTFESMPLYLIVCVHYNFVFLGIIELCVEEANNRGDVR